RRATGESAAGESAARKKAAGKKAADEKASDQKPADEQPADKKPADDNFQLTSLRARGRWRRNLRSLQYLLRSQTALAIIEPSTDR
ncbi:hypothetical protein E4U11_000853, partial [Claviceps purpurea]